MSATELSDRRIPARGRKWLVSLLMTLFSAVVLLPGLMLGNYSSGLLAQAFIFGMVAIATDLIWGFCGILTFASAAMFGIGAYTLGITFVHYSSSPAATGLAFVIAMACAGLVSIAIGWLAFYSRAKVSEFYIAVVTLGISTLFTQAVLYGGTLTGGSNGLSGFRTTQLDNQTWYLLTATLLLLSLLAARVIVRSDFGMFLKAIRDNEVRCRYVGIRTPRAKTLIFSACNAVIAAVGVLFALSTAVVAPSLAGMTLSTNVLIWVILGGRATLIGPAFAAIVVTAVTPQLSMSMPLYWQGLLGLVFVIVVVFLPAGVLPAIWAVVGSLLKAAGRKSVAGTMPLDYKIGTPSTANSGLEEVLEIRDVSKSFGSFKALSDVSMTVRSGELLSIVGPNGAGKTTLVKCIADGDERTSGTILVGGKSIESSPPEIITRLGVGRKFQAPSVFDTLTVAECLKVASWKGETPSIWKRDREMSLPPSAVEVIQSLGLKSVWNIRACDISHGQRQALELAMVLALEPSVVILDEPTAGLTVHERALVGDVLVKLVSSGRLAIILIEHDFDFVKRISTRVVVLVGGKLVASGSVAEISQAEIVREAYLGISKKEAIS